MGGFLMNKFTISATVGVLVPIISALILMYSDIQELKSTKADNKEVYEFKMSLTEPMLRNTIAVENLNETLKELKVSIDGKG